MEDYKPIPVEAAKRIAETYDKSIVIMLAWDKSHGVIHTVTYGVEPQEKAWAAQGGVIATEALGGLTALAIDFEDYRLSQAAKLLAALKVAVAIAAEAFDAWDDDNDSRVGKILAHLGDPAKCGYRADIDMIHATVKEAETFIAQQRSPKNAKDSA